MRHSALASKNNLAICVQMNCTLYEMPASKYNSQNSDSDTTVNKQTRRVYLLIQHLHFGR